MKQNPLKNFRHKDFTIKSNELCDIINQFRAEEGRKTELRHKDLLAIIRDEFDEEIGEGNFSPIENSNGRNFSPIKSDYYIDGRNRKQPCYILNGNQARQVLVRESKKVRKAVICYIDELEQKLYHKSLGIERNVSAVTHAMLSDFVNDDNRMIGLSKTIYNITSYRINAPYIYVKEELYMVDRENIAIYDEVLTRAYDLVGAFRVIDEEHYMSKVIKVLKHDFIDDVDKYEKYISTHEKRDFVIQRGFGR